MTHDGKTCCPSCGSDEAVSKAVAWDAAAEVPPKTEREIKRLKRIDRAARDLIEYSPHPGDEETAVIQVPQELMKRLAVAAGVELKETF